jgi:hypothetical protein
VILSSVEVILVRELLNVKDPIGSGIHPVEDFAENVLWVEGNNVIAAERALRPIAGHQIMAPRLDSSPVTGMLEVLIDSERNIFWGTASKLIRYIEGDTIYDVGLADHALSRNQLWSIEEFGGYMFATAQKSGTNIYAFPGDLVLPIDTSDVFTEQAFDNLDGTKILGKLNVHLIAFNILEIDEKAYAWCDAGDPTTWLPTSANTAGIAYIRDLGSPIKAIGYLGGQILVYGENEVFAVRYSGQPWIFTHRQIATGAGAWGQQAVVSLGNENFGFGPKGIWRTDGNSFRYIDRPVVYNYMYSDFNRDLADLCVAWHSSADESIVFFWPSINATELDRAIAWHMPTNTWWPVSYIRSGKSVRKAFPYATSGDTAGTVFRQIDPVKGTDPGEAEGPPYSVFSGSTPMAVKVGAHCSRGYGDYTYGSGEYGDVTNVSG